jgi:hypothetical protein
VCKGYAGFLFEGGERIMAKNYHKVPSKQWAKWNQEEQKSFNGLWRTLFPVMDMILGVNAPTEKRRLSCITWNICWVLTDELRAQRLSRRRGKD